IGSIHLRQGSLDQALARFERALDVGRRLGNLQLQVGGAIDIALVHIARGRAAEALPVLEAAQPLAERFGDPVLLGDLWQARGRAAILARNWNEARPALAAALAIQEKSGNRAGQADTLLEMARLELVTGQPATALPHATRATAIARAIGFGPGLWASLSLLGSAHASLGRLDDAAAAFTASIAEIERGRQQVAGGAEDARRFFQEKTTPYYELAALHASAGRTEDAFAVMERARARVLLDLIAGGRPIVGLLTPAQRAREAALDAAVTTLSARRDDAAAAGAARSGELAALDAELAQARRAREEWQFETFGALPDLAFGRGEAPVVPLETAVAALPPDAVVLSFMTGADRTRLVTVSRTREHRPLVRVAEIRVTREALWRRAEAFRSQLGRRDLAFAAEARSLYDLLLGPASGALRGAGPVVIVADGALWNLPFQALLSPGGRFLIEDHAVSYAPSVSALYRLEERRARRGPAGGGLVAVGDPAGATGPGTRLPNAAREVRALATMYGSGSVVLTGPAATETALRSAATSAGVLHIATHGELVRSSPMYSFVALGGDAGAVDPARDGRLEAWEVANLPLTADLAVLSACESARGADGGGEGVVGLTWSLFAAGASTAVVSLWEVDSASTTELMLALHRSLVTARRGAGPAAPGRVAGAMRAAARALIASREHRHPFYWAGFVVTGAP
ncbi:MAG: CHAT domain-containing protein, partial [Alphaproteobacteria bacterium]